MGTRVLFIGGSGRSGSTLVERLLGELPGVCAVGEVVHLWERGLAGGEPCGCGRPLRQCPFWTRVGLVAFGGWDALDVPRVLALKAEVDRNRVIPRLAAGRLSPALRDRVAEYTALYARLYAAVAQVSGARVVVDSSKHASLAFNLRWCPQVELRVLHLLRDARAVAYSWQKEMRRNAGADMDTFGPVRSTGVWLTLNAGFHLLAARGVPTVRIRYEDFMADPVGALGRIAGFAGQQVPGADLAFLSGDRAELTVAHTASGNPMRFVTGPVELRRDEAWRQRLRGTDRRLVASLALPLLARYGYLPRRRRPVTV